MRARLFLALLALVGVLPATARAQSAQPLSPSGSFSNRNPTYTWRAANGASDYMIAVDTASGEPRFRVGYRASQVCSGSTCSATPWQTPELGSYVWYVLSVYPDGSEEWSGGLAFSIVLHPVPLLSPRGGTSEPRPTFVWRPVSDATHYTLAIDTADGQLVQRIMFHTASVCSGAVCSFTRYGPLPIGSYMWYVMPSNSGGEGPWGAGASFAVTPLPAPTPNAPAGNLATLQPTYVWTHVGGATGYLLLVDDATPAHVVNKYLFASEVCSASSCAYAPGALPGAGAYTWYVQAENDSGPGVLSAGTRFVAPSWNGQGFCPGTAAAGDFDGDGRTDRLCANEGVTTVALSTGSGFGAGAAWLERELAAPLVADFNGDGKADVGEYDGASAIFRVGLSSGGGFAAPVPWGVATTTDGGGDSCTHPVQLGIGNFDGNGLPDVYCQGGSSSRIFIGKNSGSGLTFSVFADYSCWGVHERAGVADFDGDGRDDWFCTDGYGGLYARLNNGHSFEDVSFQGLGQGFCEQDGILLADLNGDGRTDATCSGTGAVALSTGAALLEQGVYGGWCDDAESRMAPLDLDGDGLPELVCTHAGAGGSDVLVRRWEGAALSPPWLSQAGFCGGPIYGGDFDGNGRSELLCHDGRSLPGGASAPPADLLLEAGNGLGGRTTVGYVPSSHFPTGNNPPVKPLVASVTRHDGRGRSATSSFSYEGARVDRREAEDLGFSRVRVVSPCLSGESQCPYTDTWQSQELPSVGRPTRRERRDGAGRLHESVSYTYLNRVGPPRRAVLTRVETADHVASGGSRVTAVTYAYDSYGNVTQTAALGEAAAGDEVQTDVTYADADLDRYIVNRPRLVERREPGGSALASEEIAYDGAVGPTAVKRHVTPATGSRSFVERTIGYDDATGNPTRLTNERGGETTLVYDADGLRVETVTNAAQATTSTVWHPLCGQPTSVTDANGQITANDYDALCRLTHTRTPPDARGQQALTTRSYVGFGDPGEQRVRVEAPGTNGNDFVETYFDGLGRGYRSVSRGPGGRKIVETRSWNERGALATASAPFYAGDDPETTAYTYDAFDRPVRVLHPDTTESLTAYGLWSVTSTDANGRPTTREHTLRSVVERTTVGGEEVATTSRLDPLGRLVAIEDALGNRWTWTYDSLGRVIDQVDPDAGRTRFAYDEATGIDTQTDAKGQVTTLAHDPARRVLSRQNDAGTTTYAYGTAAACPEACNVGRLIGVTFPGASSTMDYDALGRTVRHARTLDSVEYVVRREYDAAGRLSAIVYPDGDRIGPLGYDEAGRLTTIPGILEGLTYDAAGRPLEQRNANGTVTLRGYWPGNGLSRTLSTTGPPSTTGPGGVVQQIEYTEYNRIGLLRRVTSAVDGENWEYGYDDAYRLTAATNLTQPAESQGFVYDKIGRITESSRYGVYAYPGAGEPRPHGPTSVGGTALTYDSNGNTMTAGTRSLVWNADNLPAQVTLGAATTTFAYDGFGERVKKSSSGADSLYPFGDDYEIASGVITRYVSVDGLGVIAKRVTSGPEPGTYWLHTDRLGSIQAVTDGGGSTVFRRTYRPYGETLAEGGSHTESRGWIDQRNDRETGLTYLHARYFDPQLGVFLSPDRLNPTLPAVGLNRYAYGFGNPINVSDRTGLAGAWADCGDGSGDGCWYDIGGLDTVVEVTAGGMMMGGAFLDQVLGRFGLTPILALPVPQTGTGDDTGNGGIPEPHPSPGPPPPPPPPLPLPAMPKGPKPAAVVFGVQFKAVAVGGVQCGAGGYIADDDVGLTGMVGYGGGWDIAAEGYVGTQNTDSLEGKSVDVSVSPKVLAGFGGSMSIDPETKTVTGATATVGVSPVPAANGWSVMHTSTGTLSLAKPVRSFVQEKIRNRDYVRRYPQSCDR